MEAIGLNPVRLDAIGIDPIRLNAIRLGVPGSSSGSDRPYIAPEVLASLVAVVKCDGKSNNDPDRAIIKNLVDPDNPFVISNAAYKLNSGFGKYEEDFSTWKANSGIKISSDGTKIETLANNFSCQYDYSSIGRDTPSFKVKISNFTEGAINYYYREEDGNEKHINFGPITVANSKGIIELPKSYNTVENGIGFRGGFVGILGVNIGVTIEQIPSFQGSFYADGVNDMITSTKTMSEMLGGGNKCTVISFITHISGAGKYNVIGNNRIQVSDYSGQSFMAGCSSKSGEKIVELGDKEKIQSFQYTTFDSKLSIGSLESGLEINSYAYYGTFVFNKDSVPIDWIHQVIAYFYLDKYVTPDIIYDTIRQGITNENHASFNDELVDFSGNGHNLKIYNSAWKLGSGIGKYKADYSTWIKVAGVTSTPFGFKITGEISSNYWLVYAYNSITPAHKVKVSGIPEGGELRYASESVKLENGINELPEMEATSARGFTIRQYTTQLSDWTGLSVEQIPDYEGALVTDAVDDYGKVDNLPIYKDYTVVADREIVDGLITNADGGVATRGTSFNNGAFCFDFQNSVFSFGNGTSKEIDLKRFISYQSKYINNGLTIDAGDIIDTNPLCIARLGSTTNRYSKLALWSLLLFPYTLSEFLLERQLKRYKLGTLYPDMVKFRPVIKSNSEYSRVEIFYRSVEYPNVGSITAIVGNYYPTDGTLLIKVFPNNIDEVSNILVNGKLYPITYNASDKSYQSLIPIAELKSPQKIDITIDEYIRYEDIVQPYPCIVPIIDTNGKTYSWGDKIKVGTEIQGGIIGIAQANLLPDLYKVTGYFNFNGVSFAAGIKHVIGKTNVFELTNAPTYLKANEPNCIADPQRLRIPNSSYKILGYIPDISGHGNHLKINNSAYAGMSGANGYMADFTNWQQTGVEGKATDSKFEAIGIASTRWILYKGAGYNFPTTTYIVTGIPKDVSLTYNNDTTALQIENGVPFTIASYSASSSTGFVLSKGVGADLTGLIIEQIGEYEGSFCLDGVDDFITIPTLEGHGGKQVLMKVNYRLNSSRTCTLYDQRTILSGWQETFTIVSTSYNIAYALANNGQTYIDGILNTNIIGNSLANITHNITVVNENVSESNTGVINIGAQAEYKGFGNLSLFAFMSFDDISSEEEIKELNDIVGIEGGYVESPDYYWDAYGKSNTQADDIDDGIRNINNSKMSIFDKSITGLTAIEQTNADGKVGRVYDRALVANNFAYNEESGYGGWLGIKDLTNAFNEEKVINKWKRGGTLVKGIDADNLIGCGYGSAIYYDDVNHSFKFKIKITGLTNNDTLFVVQYYITEIVGQQLFNGINEVTIDISNSPNPNYPYFTFKYPPLTNNVDFEFLYEYQNGIVSDGVEDHLINTVIPAFTDFTVIAKRVLFEPIKNSAFCCKGQDYYTDGAFMLEYTNLDNYQISSFGALRSGVEVPELVTYMTSTNYNGNIINKGTREDKLGLYIGRYNEINFWKGVFYKMMLYSKTIDQLSINMLKNLFEKDELIDVNNPIFKQNN